DAPHARLAVPTSGDELLTVARNRDRIDRRADRICVAPLTAQVHQPTPLPMLQFRLAAIEKLERVAERVFVDLRRRQTDAGDIGFVLFRLLRLFRLNSLGDGDLLSGFGGLLRSFG